MLGSCAAGVMVVLLSVSPAPSVEAPSRRMPINAQAATSSAAPGMNLTPSSRNRSATDPSPVQFGEGQEFYVQVAAAVRAGEKPRAPTVPQNVTATVAEGKIELAWDAANDPIGVVAYRVIRDGIAIAETADLRYIAPDGTPGVRYVFTVSAIDRAGNVSPPSLPVAATIAVPTVTRTLSIL